MMKELDDTGKIIYQLRRREHNKVIYAEIFGEPQEFQRGSADKLMIRKVNLIER